MKSLVGDNEIVSATVNTLVETPAQSIINNLKSVVSTTGDAANAAVQNTNDQVNAAKQAAADKVNEGANKLLKGAGLK